MGVAAMCRVVLLIGVFRDEVRLFAVGVERSCGLLGNEAAEGAVRPGPWRITAIGGEAQRAIGPKLAPLGVRKVVFLLHGVNS